MCLRKEQHNVTMFICTAHCIPFYATDSQCYVRTYGTTPLPSQRRGRLQSGSVVQELVLLCSNQSSDQETDNCDHEEAIQPTHALTHTQTVLLAKLKLCQPKASNQSSLGSAMEPFVHFKRAGRLAELIF
jgi:hypothetical protein